MVSWQNTYEILVRELELIRKKRQALESLFSSGRISKATYDYINEELGDTWEDVERLRKSFQEKMTARLNDLEKQKENLERFLTSLELYNAAGEIEKESYESQKEALNVGLEATIKEIADIKEALSKLSPEAEAEEEVSEETVAPVMETEVETETTETIEPMETVEEVEESEEMTVTAEEPKQEEFSGIMF